MRIIRCDICGNESDVHPFTETMPRAGGRVRLASGEEIDLCASCVGAVRLQIEVMKGQVAV